MAAVPGYPRLRYVGGAAAKPAEQRSKPWFLARLERFAEWLGLREVDIYSGSGGPSVRGAGFPGDPHDRGVAVDAKAVTASGRTVDFGTVAPERTFERFGLVSGNQPNFYLGRPDPAHVQAASGGVTGGAGAQGTGNLSYVELQRLWVQAGGSRAWALVMAAVALSESGGDPNAHRVTSKEDSRGPWQINVRAHPQYANVNLYDPLTNARAAVAIFNDSGPGAWSTYTSGAYRANMGGAGGPPGARGPLPTRPARPGGGSSDGGGGIDDVLGSIFHFGEHVGEDALGALLPGVPGVGGLWGLIHGTASPLDFFKFMVALLNPLNWLRAVELLAGLGLILVGLHALAEQLRQPHDDPERKAPKRRAARRAASVALRGAVK